MNHNRGPHRVAVEATPTETAAPRERDGRKTNAHAPSLARSRAGTDPRRVPDAHPVNPHPVRALAYDRGEEYDPADPVAPNLLEALSLMERARPIIGEDGPYDRARQRRRERRQANGIPAWFSAEDLIAASWETAQRRFV